MRYLDSRDNYLRKVSERKVQKQEEILNYQYKKIFENVPGSGALGNEINWGDSLLGRLINSTLRKAQEGINTMQMSRLIARLKAHFQYILGMGVTGYLSDIDRRKIAKFQIATLLRALTEAVENGSKIREIKRICDETIDSIEKIKVDEDSEDTKKELLEKLTEFRKWLNQFDDEEGEFDPEKDEEDKEDKDEKESEDAEGSSEGSEFSPGKLYPTMVKALKNLSLVLSNYKKVSSSTKVVSKLKYVTKDRDTLKKIETDINANKNQLKAKDIKVKNQQVKHNGKSKSFSIFFKDGPDSPYYKAGVQDDLQELPAGIELVMESSFLFEDALAGSNKVGSKNPIGSGAGIDRNIGASGDDHATQALNKIKKACQILENTSDKGIGVTVDFLNKVTSEANSERGKKLIKKLFIEINRNLVGDKKSTLNAPSDPLYKESLDVIDSDKMVVAQKIARFTVRALQFDGENLYGSLGDLGQPLKNYVECFKTLKKMEAPKENKKEDKKEDKSKNEKLLFRYQDFYSQINEAQDDEEVDDETLSVSDQVREYFEENFDVTYWAISQKDVDEIEEKLKLAGDKTIVINGTGPILEVMRLFNRAYKIHTKNAIPFSGRTDGKLNVMTMNQWTAFGNTSGEMKGKGEGPYRNNKIFNQWEDAVYDVFKEYEPVFDKGTKLKIGDRIKDEAGVALRNFMVDLLDGDDLYKSGGATGEGAQKKALNKYFDDVPEFEKVDNEDMSLATEDGKTDLEENEEKADKIKDKNISFVPRDPYLKDSILRNGRPSEVQNMFFSFTTKDTTDIRYCFIQEVKNDYVYIVYTKNFWYFQKYLETQNGPVKKTKKMKTPFNIIAGGGQNKVWATRIPNSKLFTEILKPGKKIKLDAVDIKGDGFDTSTIDVVSIDWLCLEQEENKTYDLLSINDRTKLKSALGRNQGFENIENHIKSKVTKDKTLETKVA